MGAHIRSERLVDAAVTFFLAIVMSCRLDFPGRPETRVKRVYIYLLACAWFRLLLKQVCEMRGIPWLDDVFSGIDPEGWASLLWWGFTDWAPRALGVSGGTSFGDWIGASADPQCLAHLEGVWARVPAWATVDWWGSVALYLAIAWCHGSSATENRLLMAVHREANRLAATIVAGVQPRDSVRAADAAKRLTATITQGPQPGAAELLCPVCMDRERCVLSLPCRHLMTCRECHLKHAAAQVPLRCVMCRAPTTETVLCAVSEDPTVGDSYTLTMPFYCA